MKALVVVVVAFLVCTFVAFQTEKAPASYTCGQAHGGVSVTVKGVEFFERVGRLVRDVADHPDKYRKAAAGDTWAQLKIAWVWLRTAWLSARGEKLDPEIVKLKEAQEKAQREAEDSCTPPCPDAGNPDDPDIRASLPVSARRGLSGAQLAADAARAARFPEAQLPMAVAVARLESSFRPDASLTFRGAHMRGMWQINDHAHPELFRGGVNWADPYVNARMAKRVYDKAGQSWQPWSTAAAARRSLRPVPPPADGEGPKVDDCVPDRPADGTGDTGSIPASFADFHNPRSAADAVAFMARMTRDKTPIGVSRCLHYVGLAYGHPGTSMVRGRFWAKDQYWATPKRWRHAGDRDAPRGALMYWNIRDGHPGHIAVSAGGGWVFSTDAPVRGRVGLVKMSYFNGYGGYLGWTPPYFVGKTRVGAEV